MDDKWKFVDTIFDFTGLNGFPSRCGIKFYHAAGGYVVVLLTELPDNPGTSVTNAVNILSRDIVLQFGLDPVKVIWVEHSFDDAESFDQVSFPDGSARWRHLGSKGFMDLVSDHAIPGLSETSTSIQ